MPIRNIVEESRKNRGLSNQVDLSNQYSGSDVAGSVSDPRITNQNSVIARSRATRGLSDSYGQEEKDTITKLDTQVMLDKNKESIGQTIVRKTKEFNKWFAGIDDRFLAGHPKTKAVIDSINAFHSDADIEQSGVEAKVVNKVADAYKSVRKAIAPADDVFKKFSDIAGKANLTKIVYDGLSNLEKQAEENSPTFKKLNIGRQLFKGVSKVVEESTVGFVKDSIGSPVDSWRDIQARNLAVKQLKVQQAVMEAKIDSYSPNDPRAENLKKVSDLSKSYILSNPQRTLIEDIKLGELSYAKNLGFGIMNGVWGMVLAGQYQDWADYLKNKPNTGTVWSPFSADPVPTPYGLYSSQKEAGASGPEAYGYTAAQIALNVMALYGISKEVPVAVRSIREMPVFTDKFGYTVTAGDMAKVARGETVAPEVLRATKLLSTDKSWRELDTGIQRGLLEQGVSVTQYTAKSWAKRFGVEDLVLGRGPKGKAFTASVIKEALKRETDALKISEEKAKTLPTKEMIAKDLADRQAKNKAGTPESTVPEPRPMVELPIDVSSLAKSGLDSGDAINIQPGLAGVVVKIKPGDTPGSTIVDIKLDNGGKVVSAPLEQLAEAKKVIDDLQSPVPEAEMSLSDVTPEILDLTEATRVDPFEVRTEPVTPDGVLTGDILVDQNGNRFYVEGSRNMGTINGIDLVVDAIDDSGNKMQIYPKSFETLQRVVGEKVLPKEPVVKPTETTAPAKLTPEQIAENIRVKKRAAYESEKATRKPTEGQLRSEKIKANIVKVRETKAKEVQLQKLKELKAQKASEGKLSRRFFNKVKESVAKKFAPIESMKDTKARDILREFQNKELINTNVAERIVRKELGNIPKKLGKKLIAEYQAGIENKYTNQIANAFGKLYRFLKKNEGVFGKEVKFQQNYLLQVWKDSVEKVKMAAIEYSVKERGMSVENATMVVENILNKPENATGYGQTPGTFIFEKLFPDYAKGQEYGLTPAYTHPAEILGYAWENALRQVENKAFIDDMTKQGKFVNTKVADRATMKPITAGIAKGMSAVPELADVMGGMAKEGNIIGKSTKWVASKTQEMVLTAGVPFTDVNYFSFGYLARELARGNVHAIVPFVRANFPTWTKAWAESAKVQKSIMEMATQGIDVTNINSFKTAYKNIVEWKGTEGGKTGFDFNSTFGNVWHKAFNEKTFQSYITQVHIDAYMRMKETLLKEGLSDYNATKVAAANVKNAFGLIDMKSGRTVNFENLISSVLFAPKFRESMMNVAFNTFRSVGGVDKVPSITELTKAGKVKYDYRSTMLNPNYRMNRRLMVGSVLTYATYNVLNYRNTGHFMWDNPVGHEMDLAIQNEDKSKSWYVPYLPGSLGVPKAAFGAPWELLHHGDLIKAKQKAAGFFSIPIKTYTELTTNRSFFDQPIYITEREATADVPQDPANAVIRKSIAYLIDSMVHPYIKEPLEVMMSKQSFVEGLTTALEVPVKYGDTQKEQIQSTYMLSDRLTTRLARIIPEHKTELIKAELMKLPLETRKELLGYLNNPDLTSSIGFTDADLAIWAEGPHPKKLKTGEGMTREMSLDSVMAGKNILQQLPAWAEAFKASPINAMLATGLLGDKEVIRKISPKDESVVTDPITGKELPKKKSAGFWWAGTDAVIFERKLGLSLLDGGDPTTQVDHKIPIWLGGSNDLSNIEILANGEHAKKSQVDIYLMEMFRSGRMTSFEAKKMIKNWQETYRNLTQAQLDRIAKVQSGFND